MSGVRGLWDTEHGQLTGATLSLQCHFINLARPSILPSHSAHNPWSTLSLAQTLLLLSTQIVRFCHLRRFGPHLALIVAPKEASAGTPSPMTTRTYSRILTMKATKISSGEWLTACVSGATMHSCSTSTTPLPSGATRFSPGPVAFPLSSIWLSSL